MVLKSWKPLNKIKGMPFEAQEIKNISQKTQKELKDKPIKEVD